MRGACAQIHFFFLVAVEGAGLRKSRGGRDIQIILSGGECEMGNELDCLGERKIQIILSGGEKITNERRVCPNPDFVFRWRSGGRLTEIKGRVGN